MTTMNGALNSDWQVFLRARGARAGAESADVETFGDPAAERLAASEGAVLCDLSHLGVIGFAGSDAQVFLQGQLTCDVREASTRASRPGALCTPKGRALATFVAHTRRAPGWAGARDCSQDALFVTACAALAVAIGGVHYRL
ncbi:MAG: hypothetical protein ACK5WE_17770, partial [bacterium]